MDLSKYIDATAPLDVPIRYSSCPLCNTSKNSFVVIPKRKGYFLYCHRCHAKRWLSRDKKSPSQVLATLQEQKKSAYVMLPHDFTTQIPAEQRVWFYKYGLDDENIATIGAGYSEMYKRVILPCYNGEELIYWTGRYTGKYKKDKVPKYISRTKYGHTYGTYGLTPIAIIVEDLISAYKLSLSGFTGICIFGSYVPDSLIKELKNKYSEVIIWLDSDKRAESAKLKKRHDSFDESIHVLLRPDKDPKEYSITELQTRINSVVTKQVCEN